MNRRDRKKLEKRKTREENLRQKNVRPPLRAAPKPSGPDRTPQWPASNRRRTGKTKLGRSKSRTIRRPTIFFMSREGMLELWLSGIEDLIRRLQIRGANV